MREMSTEDMMKTINDQEKCIAELRKKCEELQIINKPSKLYVGNNATPMTVAEMVVRECSDYEWLDDVVYYIKAYINRTYDKNVEVRESGDKV